MSFLKGDFFGKGISGPEKNPELSRKNYSILDSEPALNAVLISQQQSCGCKPGRMGEVVGRLLQWG